MPRSRNAATISRTAASGNAPRAPSRGSFRSMKSAPPVAHDSFDYLVNGTRIVCNPRGYAKARVNKNPRFDPDLMVEVS